MPLVQNMTMQTTHHLMPTPRHVTLAPLLQFVWRSLAEATRSRVAEWRRRSVERAHFRALHELDDRTLHDLGFHRSEIGSLARAATDADRLRRGD